MLLVSYFPTLLPKLIFHLLLSSLVSLELHSSPLCWSPVRWHTSESERESRFLTELCKHSLILLQTFQSFLSSAQTHLTLPLQWPPAVWQGTQTVLWAVLVFQNVWEMLLFSSRFSVPNKHSSQQNTETCMPCMHSHRTRLNMMWENAAINMTAALNRFVCHSELNLERLYSTISEFELRYQKGCRIAG